MQRRVLAYGDRVRDALIVLLSRSLVYDPVDEAEGPEGRELLKCLLATIHLAQRGLNLDTAQLSMMKSAARRFHSIKEQPVMTQLLNAYHREHIQRCYGSSCRNQREGA